MTIAVTTNSRTVAGNGSTAIFTFTFFAFDEDDIKVYLESSAGVRTAQVLNVGYTLVLSTDVSNPGGTITMATAPASGETLIIYRQPDFLQADVYAAPNKAIERDYDRRVIEGQFLLERSGLSLRTPVGSGLAGEITGAPTAGQSIVVTSGLDGFVWGTPVTQSVSTALLPVVQAPSLAAARAALGDTHGFVSGKLTTAPGTATPIWEWRDANDAPISQAGTANMGFQQAINAAVNNGYALLAYGQGNNTGGHGTQGGYVSSVATTVSLPPMQFLDVTLRNFDLACSGMSSSPGFLVNTNILGDFDWTGQLTYVGSGSAFTFAPSSADPEDGGTFIADSCFRLPNIADASGTNSAAAACHVDLSHGGVVQSYFHAPELNGGQYSFLVDGPSVAGSAWRGSVVHIGHAHLSALGAVQIGTSATRQSQLGGNLYFLGSLRPKTAGAHGIDTFGSGDIFLAPDISNGEGACDIGLKFQAGANNNVAIVGNMQTDSADFSDLGTGNIIIGKGAVRTPALKFPSTQQASADVNTLDDYKEGTFTPTIVSAGGGTPTYAVQIGSYTKIGNRVFYDISVGLATLGTLAAGLITIAGLPVAANSTTNKQQAAAVAQFALDASVTTSVMGLILSGASVVTLYKYAAGAGAQLTVAGLSGTSVFYISGQYQV